MYPVFSHDEPKHLAKLREYAKSVTTIPISTFFANIKCIVDVFSEKPFTVDYFYSKKMLEIIQSQDCDIVLADCSSMAQYAINIKKPKIVDFVDIDSDKWRLYSERCMPLKSFIYNLEYKRLHNFEDEISRKFDFCLVVSENEKRLLNSGDNVVVIPNGIDLQFFTPRAKKDENTLIFTGAMDYFPNIDGVSYFHRDIWPLVKECIRGVKFVVAGMCPPAKIRALASKDTVITGYIPDIRDYLAQATVCVVPLRIAKGIQNKVLEAMAMGVPVVATTAANAGINAKDKHQILIADSPEAFARAVVKLLQDQQLRHALAEHARQFVQENFNWETHLSKLDGLISRLVQK